MPFTQFDRATDAGYQDLIWVHDTAPVWICFYPAVEGRADKYEAFRSVARIPKGRMPWAVNNKRISNGDGFKTLADAMRAATVQINKD